MEKKITQRQEQRQTQSTASTTTTTTTTTTAAITSDNRDSPVVVVVIGGGESTMGGNRSGSTSSSVGWMGDGGEQSKVNTPTTPRQPSNRDSGYHTDFSPATFATTHHFTFDTPPVSPRSHSQGSPAAGSRPLPRSSLTVSPGWQPRRVLPDVDSDDDGDDDAFVSDNASLGIGVSQLSGSDFSCDALTLPRTGLRSWSAGDDCSADFREDTLGFGDHTDGGRHSRGHSPRNVSFQRVRHVVEDSEEEGEGEEEGVASTDYHHAPLSLVTLPSGERIRPLLARTIATQTPHLHCQLIDQILDCPQDFPQSARGSAVRRLRYYSEGEESVGVSSLTRGPLPDIVPVSHAHRERSLSAPDLESLQRQRLAARQVGRELRRISDEFIRNHEALRGNQPGALAALHAELNGVAAFFLTGVRRFLYRGFAGYFRHVFHWTRQALNNTQPLPDSPQDSCVDDQQR